jgi:hypothetical protein
MSVVPLLAAVLELKTIVDSVRWLNEHYIGGEEMISKAICWRGLSYIRGKLHIFEYKLSPQSGPCLLLKKGGGLFSGVMTLTITSEKY